MSSQPQHNYGESSQNQFESSDHISRQQEHKRDNYKRDVPLSDDQHDPQQSQSENSEQENHSNSSEEVQLTQFKRLEAQILGGIAAKQKHTPYQKQIMEDILEKLEGFRDAIRGKTGEELVNLRIQELVLTKILVSTYGKSEFRLVVGQYNLGNAYMEYECVQQAIEHISMALHKNDKIVMNGQVLKASLYHTYLQNSLAKCLIQKGSFDDAVDLLKNVVDIKNRNQKTHQEGPNTETMILLSQCQCKLKQFGQAMETINTVIKSIEERKQTGQQLALALVQKASIQAANDNYEDAINSQETAINLLIEANYSKPEEVAEMYVSLAKYYENVDQIQNALNCMQKVRTLNQELYAQDDKKVIKARRKIATLYLKTEKYKQAVKQLADILELQEKNFGQNSLACARTLKLLGTVYISVELGDARSYLKRSMAIFSQHGSKKQVLEIKNKLKLLSQNIINPSSLDLKVITEQDAS